MPILGFSSASEFYVYATLVLLGVSMLMPLNALTSAPLYMSEYYKYVSNDPNAVPNKPVFWANILTFYNVASVVTQVLCGPTVLTPQARKLSLRQRYAVGLLLMMVEIFVTMVMPVGHGVSQNAAIVAFFIVTIAAGAGKSYLEATCYATAGSMPPKFMSAVMFGCGFSGVIASILQCIVKVSFPNTYEAVRTEAYIYFSLALGIMVCALLMALSLRWNRFAQTYIGEFRMAHLSALHKDEMHGADAALYDVSGVPNCPTNEHRNDRALSGRVGDAAGVGDAPVMASPILDDTQTPSSPTREDAAARAKEKQLAAADGEAEQGHNAVQAVGEDGTEAVEDENMTTSEQLVHTNAWSVMKRIYPMQIACFNVFFLSMIMFPSLIIAVDRTDLWFSTIAVLLYNCGDATGRLSSTFKIIWPPRKAIIIVSFARFALLPFIFLCIYKYIPGYAFPYILMFVVGLTNGFFGALTMVYGPITPTLRTKGEHVMAGQLMGMALLAGCSVASMLAVVIVLYLP